MQPRLKLFMIIVYHYFAQGVLPYRAEVVFPADENFTFNI